MKSSKMRKRLRATRKRQSEVMDSFMSTMADTYTRMAQALYESAPESDRGKMARLYFETMGFPLPGIREKEESSG